jgi:hypothetical protein
MRPARSDSFRSSSIANRIFAVVAGGGLFVILACGGRATAVNVSARDASSGDEGARSGAASSGAMANHGTMTDGGLDVTSVNTAGALLDAASEDAGDTGGSMKDAGDDCASSNSGCGAIETGSLGDARAPYRALAVTAGQAHTCVLLDDHKIKCWGQNEDGQLGLGDTMPRGANPGEMGDSLPTVDLGTGHSAVAVAAGFTATCAILDNGQVKCWGQLGGTGGGPTPGSKPGQMGDNLPALDLGGHRALAVAPGERGATILLDDGSVWGWYLSQPVGPLEGVPSNRRAVMITPEAQYPPAPVLLDDGTVVGAATGTNQEAPVVVLSPGETARGVFRSQNLPGLCATLERGGIRCNAPVLDYSPVADDPTNGPPLRSDFASLALGQLGEFLCALTFDGEVQCWRGPSTSGWAPAPGGGFTAPVDHPVVALSPGGVGHFCALLADGTVECFGDDGPALGRGGMSGTGPVDLGRRSVYPDIGTCASSTQCLGQDGSQGQLCVLSHCVPCARDADCRFDAYSAHAGLTMCNIGAGKCVSPSCAAPGASCGSGANTNGNGADLCCGTSSPMCVAGGTCCTSHDCSAGQSCFRHACVSCGAPGGTYYVDPYLGSDDSESGGNGSSSCPFQSLTHAVPIAAAAGRSATIAIANPGPVVPLLDESTGEVFPIVVPQGIAITDTASPTLTGLGFSMGYSAPPVVGIREGQTGFVLASPNSSLSDIRIDGQGENDTGIVVFGGSDAATTRIDHVTLSNLGTAGIAIGPAAAGMHAGHAALVGVSVSLADIFISGDGSATITGGASLDGLTVKDSASVAITGTISVDTIDNVPGAIDAIGDTTFYSLSILQTPGATALSQINGALVYGQLQVSAGSHLRLRGSWITSGVTVTTSVTGVPTDDLTTIDLGNSVGPDYGLNTFVSNMSPGSPGLCLQVKPSSGTLLAAGNRFAYSDVDGLVEPHVDCTAGGMLSRSPSCTSASDGMIDIGGIAAGDSTRVDVTHCE